MFDLKNEHKHSMEELETKINKYLQLSETHEKLIGELKHKEKNLCEKLEDIETKKRDLELELDQQISELQELTKNYNSFREDSKHTIDNLETYIIKRVRVWLIGNFVELLFFCFFVVCCRCCFGFRFPLMRRRITITI
jgi:tRNA/tmRNA/rRNA uracil-C5-methylase (TrmA/RlmC/RlmD family)